MLLGAILLVLVQAALGMVVNLYVTVPAHHPGAHAANYIAGSLHSVAWAIAHGAPTLAVHATLGLALVVFVVGGAVRRVAIRPTRDRGIVGSGWAVRDRRRVQRCQLPRLRPQHQLTHHGPAHPRGHRLLRDRVDALGRVRPRSLCLEGKRYEHLRVGAARGLIVNAALPEPARQPHEWLALRVEASGRRAAHIVAMPVAPSGRIEDTGVVP